jgi:hypothetical protein
MRVRGVITLGLIVVGCVAGIVSDHQVDKAEGNVGKPKTTRIDTLATITVNEFYSQGGWGPATCSNYLAHPVASTPDTERIWDDRLDDYYFDHPDHQYKHVLGEHPALADLAGKC